jgi:hypothetical protein
MILEERLFGLCAIGVGNTKKATYAFDAGGFLQERYTQR